MSVGAICMRSAQVASPEETVRAVATRMADEGVGTVVVVSEGRPLAVVGDDGRLVGILALDDALELLSEELATIGKLLRQRAELR